MAHLLVLSRAERQFVCDGVAQDVRNDGRRRDESRVLSVETGCIPQATGSARLTLGNTVVLACVKAEIGVPSPDRPTEGRVEIAVDCSPAAAPEFQGKGGEDLAQDLASALHSSFRGGGRGAGGHVVEEEEDGLGEGEDGGRLRNGPGRGAAGREGDREPWVLRTQEGDGEGVGGERGEGAVDLGQLGLVAGKRCWVLYLDALVMSMDGNLLGAISMAFKAALRDSVLPQVEVVMGDGESGEPELEIVDDGTADNNRINTANVPLIVTLSQIGKHCVVDATAEEEAVANASVWLAVRADGRVSAAGLGELGGGAAGGGRAASLPLSVLRSTLETATIAGKACHTAVDRELEAVELRRQTT